MAAAPREVLLHEIRERLPGCRRCSTYCLSDKETITENGHVGYKCTDCFLIYIAPKPDPKSIVNLYDHDDAQVSAAQWIASSSTYGRALKARHTLKQIRRHVRHGDLLEIGAGGGAFARQARKHFKVHAAEFNPKQVEHLKAMGIDCRRGAFSEVFQGQKFDVIYHCDVLSHLSDPVVEFKAMRSMLNPGGVLVFETGNNGDMFSKYYPLVETWMYPDHLYFFSQESLKNLAFVSGFDSVESRVYSRELEMRVMKKLQGAKQRAQGSGTATVSFKRKLMLNVKHLLDYLMIYRIGAIAPKLGRPQTVISVWRPS